MIAGHKVWGSNSKSRKFFTISLHLLAVWVQVVTPSICGWSISHPLFSLNRTDASFPQTPESAHSRSPTQVVPEEAHTDTGVPEVSKAAGGSVGRLHPSVLSPRFGCLSSLLLVLFTLDVLRIRLDPVALCVAAGVHRWGRQTCCVSSQTALRSSRCATLTYLDLVCLTEGHECRRVVDPGNLDVSWGEFFKSWQRNSSVRG